MTNTLIDIYAKVFKLNAPQRGWYLIKPGKHCILPGMGGPGTIGYKVSFFGSLCELTWIIFCTKDQ